MPSSQHRRQPSRTSSRFTRTEIIIHVYDLLPPSNLSSLLWPLGLSLLHTGVVLHDREYAYGATPATPAPSRPTPPTGVFWTPPRLEPPGGTFRAALTQGITFLPRAELDALVRDVSAHFPGDRYDLLGNNCNHFTNALCKALTGRDAPAWINRAARVGTVLPCLVPATWREPPEDEDEDEEAVVEGEGSDDSDPDESAGMMQSAKRQQGRASMDSRRESLRLKDTSGRELPSSELARADRLVEGA